MGIALYQEDMVSSGECIDCLACVENCPRHNITANPTPSVAAAMTVVAMTGLYYVGSLTPQSSNEIGASAVTTVSSAAQGQYTDGIYTGSASGYKGETAVQVTVKNGYITDITILSTGDDEAFFNKAKNTVISEILSSQSTQVDTVTGATFSSNAIIHGVSDALGSMDESSIENQESSAAAGDSADETTTAASAASYRDGVYTGTGLGFRGNTTVSVTVYNGKVTDITVNSYEDDAPYFNKAEDTVITNILKTQSVNVDTVTGATFSSNGIKEAVANALGITFENPNSTLETHGHNQGSYRNNEKDLY